MKGQVFVHFFENLVLYFILRFFDGPGWIPRSRSQSLVSESDGDIERFSAIFFKIENKRIIIISTIVKLRGITVICL